MRYLTKLDVTVNSLNLSNVNTDLIEILKKIFLLQFPKLGKNFNSTLNYFELFAMPVRTNLDVFNTIQKLFALEVCLI